ncbi:MAG: GGDEF domain-containing protein [Tahibacter sp.]
MEILAPFRLAALRSGVFAWAVMLMLGNAVAGVIDPGDLLSKADVVKSSDPRQFREILDQLASATQLLSAQQQSQLRYLQAWNFAYAGDYETAVPLLQSIIAEPGDLTLRFRAGVTIVNVLAISRRYQDAYSQLSQLLERLPQVTDKDAREQGLMVAGILYNQVGQYDLGLSFANQLIGENWAGRGTCKGGQLQIEALYKSGKLKEPGPAFDQAIDACNRIGEAIWSNLMRTYVVKLQLAQGKPNDAIKLMQLNYTEVQRTNYPRLVSEFDALLAEAYRQSGDATRARDFAMRAVEGAVKNEYTEPLVAAYKLLHDFSLEQGDYKTALAYYKKYASADKGYLDDVSARQLAYQMVTHETAANKLQIDALNKQNQVLQLQQALGDKAVENSRLYIVLLVTVLAFIGLWAYKTKRSQLHFMKLARRDGLTGIFNRHHFLNAADSALEYCRKSSREACLIVIDLDHFKDVNDEYGHAMGDLVLKRAVAASQVHLRSIDIFGRLGGEEFGILLPECALAAAGVQAESIRREIEAGTNSVRNVDFSISASFGVASSSHSGYELRQLMANADAALYNAKRAGRNRVELALEAS